MNWSNVSVLVYEFMRLGWVQSCTKKEQQQKNFFFEFLKLKNETS